MAVMINFESLAVGIMNDNICHVLLMPVISIDEAHVFT
jgi:hypothetical protein